MTFEHIIITGAQSTIAQALCRQILETNGAKKLTLLSRNPVAMSDSRVVSLQANYDNEAAIAQAVSQISGPIDGIFLSHGLLHGGGCLPEKSLQSLTENQLLQSFKANTLTPLLFAKYLCPLLDKKSRSFVAALSARVGSISDNRLGGWYSYRASKAALNMLIKTLALELAQSHSQCAVVALHPGTVASPLSAPFLSKIPKEQVLTPKRAAAALWELLQNLTPEKSGQLLSYQGLTIPF